MKTFIFNKENLIDGYFKVVDSEFNHLKNVLRLKVGDEIRGVCFDEFDYYAIVSSIEKNYAICKITNIDKNIKNPIKEVTVFQALIKKEHLNLEVQKLTELGVSEFIPFETEFCTVKKTESKQEKLQEVSNQSIKQCGRSKPLFVHNVNSFKEIIEKLKNFDLVIFANETEQSTRLRDINYSNIEKIAIIIGAEGGFSQNEINKLNLKNVVSVSLGKRILRAETAGIALSTLVLNMVGEI